MQCLLHHVVSQLDFSGNKNAEQNTTNGFKLIASQAVHGHEISGHTIS